jgi:hypothetical protein
MYKTMADIGRCTYALSLTGEAYPRTCEVCGNGGCKNSKAKEAFDAKAATDPVVFDVVQKAKHYNVHPSGIEAINIVRCLNFDMGCAIKYVIRRHGKEYERSLKSAEYYLKDQHHSGNCMVLNYSVFRMLDDYTQAEEVPQVATFYRLFSAYLNLPSNSNFEMLSGALSRILEGKL